MAYPELIEALRAFRRSLPKACRIYVGGCSGEPVDIAGCLTAEPDLADGVTFLGVWIPGVNKTDWAGFHPRARAESIFVSPQLRPSFVAGHTAFLPLPYTQAWAWLGSTPIDGAIILTSPADEKNHVSLGISPDFAPAVLERRGIPVLGLVHRDMPAPRHSVRVPAARFVYLAEAVSPLAGLDEAELPQAFRAIARNVAAMISPGDTLQFGLGNVQQAVLTEIAGTKGIHIHSGMISSPVEGLLDSDAEISITTGVAIGTSRFYKRLNQETRIRYRPVRDTHTLTVLSSIPRFTAINSVIEIDLFGQANAEFIHGKQISGTGGLVDFLRGAALSPGGKSILALTSTTSKCQSSRIVPRLDANATSISRADIDWVVTEHGAACLRGLSLDARAEALIGIADPAHRNRLALEWDGMRRRM